ncbi:hypothetical protein NDU88_002414 [Pleurodeles waltl]|uniref:Uncharacterized protein n=1 Tax=Pleurodeles waltl TaxID=8319 RepID=A0AAV7Q5X9_PLEWA|nr:hypothetical protein NDU88_002414 [Pleurodeles waltl]
MRPTAPSTHSLPPATHADPPTPTESPHPWALLDGRTGDSDDSRLLQRDQKGAGINGGGKERNVAAVSAEREVVVVELERLALASGDSEDREKLKLRKQELRSLVKSHTRKYETAVHHRLYEVVDKAGKLLAWLERRDRECTWVLKVKNAGHVLQTSAADIAETFADYY